MHQTKGCLGFQVKSPLSFPNTRVPLNSTWKCLKKSSGHKISSTMIGLNSRIKVSWWNQRKRCLSFFSPLKRLTLSSLAFLFRQDWEKKFISFVASVLQRHPCYTWERVRFSYSSRKFWDALLIADPAMPLASCHPATLIYCSNILVSWLDLLHLIHLQYVQISSTLAQTIRRAARTNWMDATPNQKRK